MSRTFFRKFFPAVPRAAGRPALRASALRGGEFGIIRAPGAARAGNPPAHRMPTTPARQSGGGRGDSRAGGSPRAGVSPRPIDIIAPGAQRFGSVRMLGRPAVPALRLGPYMEQPRRPGACAPRPSGAFDSTACIQLPIYKEKDWAHLQVRGPSAFIMRAALPPNRRLSPVRLRRASRGANAGARRLAPLRGARFPKKKDGRLRARPPSARAAPQRPSLVDYLCRRVSIISILKKLRCDRLFECPSISTAPGPTHARRSTPGLVLKPKKRAANAALFLKPYICWQSYASLKNFFLPT